jgi:glycosyltransferase involved in cell wall biosynthesis
VTRLTLRPYRPGDHPGAGSVALSAVVLTLNEAPNIGRCLASLAWAAQIVVVDAGSADATTAIARAAGAQVVHQPWLGYSGQREFALRLPLLRHDWVYFVDADEWVSPQLAAEIAGCLREPGWAGFSQRFRLVFCGRWIRHCGWYRGSWLVRLVDRRRAAFDGSIVGERVRVGGPVRRLANDLVDEDRKGLAAWLHKHVRYAELEAARRGTRAPMPRRLAAVRAGQGGSRPLARSVLKDVIFPAVPAKPAALFIYMYLLRLGLLDGLAGLRFCLYHAWYEATVAALRSDATAAARTAGGGSLCRPTWPGGPSTTRPPSAAAPIRHPPHAGSPRWR